MQFNSFEFIIFFLVIVSVYHLLTHRWQNRALLAASYVFYGWADWRFLFLILFSTFANYICGIGIYRATNYKKKKLILSLCVIVNLGFLGFFKYWNFFLESFLSIFGSLGFHPDVSLIHVILPIGISFYTFQVMSYSIDVYRNEIGPTYNFVDFALFVCYFPHLVAGPIMRGKTLLPQIENPRRVTKEQVVEGIWLIFWGFFKKIFVADNLAVIVNQVYGNPKSTGMEYIIATWAFAFQIYGDFSGYSDIARGTSKCLGIELVYNFRQPYFAVNPSDFWRRWHISLSSWLRDYLYIPLGGNKKGTRKTYRNLSLTMLLGGLWHGAAWNFVIWGAYHGLLLCIYKMVGDSKEAAVRVSSIWKYMLMAFIMFQLTSIGWIFFRAENLDQIGLIFKSFLNSPWLTLDSRGMMSDLAFYCFIPVFVMGYQVMKERKLVWFEKPALSKYFGLSYFGMPARGIFIGILAYLLCLHGAKAQTFIYFQF